MTTNQTIDGVPRALVQWAYSLSYAMGYSKDPRRAQLRALLDAPSCKKCGGSGWVPEPFSIRGNSMKCPECKPADQPQGEPVAKLTWEQIVGLVNEVLGCEAHKWPVHDVGHAMTGINFNSLARIIDRVQSEQPAPVAVVMPEPLPGDDGVCTESHYASGWNDCLDELKRLNPSL
ncbi:MAG: hypothetical protein Q7T99_16510 [Pseudomonas sp.]|nr:hypothetical protein [Pseudomonas sp.]